MELILPIMLLLIGLVIGGLAVLLLFKSKVVHARDQARAESDSELAVFKERLESQDKRVLEKDSAIEQHKHELKNLQSEVTALTAKEAQLAAIIKEERQQAAEKIAVYDDAKKQLEDGFKALAADALNTNNKAFLELAKTKLDTVQKEAKGELKERQTAIENLVKPMEKSLSDVDTKLKDIEKARLEAYSGLREQVKKSAEGFKGLAADALNTNNKAFLELAKTKLDAVQKEAKGELKERQTAIENLVKPMEKSLSDVDTKLKDIEKARLEAYSGLKEQVNSLATSQKELRSETANLVKALRRS